MQEHECGEIPVVDLGGMKPIGVITDRDIVCRTLAKGINPIGRSVQASMSTPVRTLPITATLDECVNLMDKYQIRRVPIVDERGELRGIVSQADLANRLTRDQIAVLLKAVSAHKRTLNVAA